MTLIIIIVVTVLVSRQAFNDSSFFSKWLFNAYQVWNRHQYYRLFTSGLLHADWFHLGINMLVFYSFGMAFVKYFEYYTGLNGQIFLAILYISALPVSSIFSLIKNKNNINYNAVGASGAVSAVVFASIFFDPWNFVYLFAVIPIPGFVFGLAYLYYSYRMGKQNRDNIGHDAHFWGAVYGFLFPVIMYPDAIHVFIQKITTWPF